MLLRTGTLSKLPYGREKKIIIQIGNISLSCRKIPWNEGARIHLRLSSRELQQPTSWQIAVVFLFQNHVLPVAHYITKGEYEIFSNNRCDRRTPLVYVAVRSSFDIPEMRRSYVIVAIRSPPVCFPFALLHITSWMTPSLSWQQRRSYRPLLPVY